LPLLVETGEYRSVSPFFDQAGKKLAHEKLAEKSGTLVRPPHNP
jgi:hypothetical protein